MPPVIINTDSISRAAKQYDPLLKALPFATLDPVLTDLGINLLEVGDGENIETTFERNGKLIKPYVASTSDKDADEKEIGRFVEMPLQTKKAYAALKDHIDNYTSEKVVINDVNKVDQATKKHPLEMLILNEKVKTVAEDQIDAMFHSKFDTSDESPMGISDGFYTLQDNFVTAGDIAASKGNIVACGSLAAPANESDITAFKSILAWLRSGDEFLKNQNVNLYIPGGVLLNIRDAAANKFRYLNDVNVNTLEQILREHALIKSLNIKTHYCMGSGTRIFLTVNGNLDYGMSKRSDSQFVQVRNPYKDPNWVQFWLQFRVGQRIKNIHRKKFMMSDGTVTSVSLSGDYQS